MTHTPGPWKYEYRSGDRPNNTNNGWGSVGLWGSDDSLIFGTGKGWEGEFEGPNEFDQCLIEQAPAMLDLLKKISRSACLNQQIGSKCICFSCESKALIAKAEGRQS